MPGYLGGGGSGGGVGGEIRFPKEFVDPVTKLRVSNPENLIDTDFEYGLQPTKWETVELINNTPSFFSKSGDTTIDNILSITTNQGTREIIVRTSQEHLLAVGIPINVQGSKSLTADGAYIINSIPDPFTFTYLCKDTQTETAAINDLYTSIITGEFFQGSQLRISDDNGIVTNGAGLSVLTVTTDSTHGFGINTPFYFLNLNSAIAQEFQAANTASKSFDASNSATAQTFDGSNTLSSINIDFSNSGVAGGTVSNIQSVNTIDETITVTHTTETFENLTLGTPLYYNVTAGSGFFLANPRGVVFLKTTGNLGATTSTFQVSETPDGPPIDLQGAMTGTFQISNQSRTFAGNNRNPETEITVTVVKEQEFEFDGGNQGFAGENPSNGSSTVLGYSDTILVNTAAGVGLDYYPGAMVFYNTTGAAATGLTNNTTYFINSITPSATADLYTITIKELPDSESILNPSGGSGTQTFEKIGVSIDKDIIHIRNANFAERDMLEYGSPENGAFETEEVEDEKQFYFVETAYDEHNYKLSTDLFAPIVATGGTVSELTELGVTYRIHTFTTVGNSSFEVTSSGSGNGIEYLIVAGGGAGGNGMGGGGGGGGVVHNYKLGPKLPVEPGSYTITVGAGGVGTTANTRVSGQNSSAFGIIALGGGGGGSLRQQRQTGINFGGSGGSGGGAGGLDSPGPGGAATQPTSASGGFGNPGGNFPFRQDNYPGAGGGGAGQAGFAPTSSGGNGGAGGQGLQVNIDGNNHYWAGGGGGNAYTRNRGGNGGLGGGGGGSVGSTGVAGGLGGGSARTTGENGLRANNARGADAGANTGGGGGGAAWETGRGGNGGSGIVILRYPITAPIPFSPAEALGGTLSTLTADGITYNIHTFTSVGTSSFQVLNTGSGSDFEVLVVGGGGGGGVSLTGGGGGGAVIRATVPIGGGTYTGIGSYPVIVGGGGPGGTGNQSTNTGGTKGGSSSVFGVIATGGGGAPNRIATSWGSTANATTGANGGGGSADQSLRNGFAGISPTLPSGVLGTVHAGFTGGTGGGGSPNYPGGGGAGSAANGGSPANSSAAGGNGGAGVLINFNGTAYHWGGGGGGASYVGGNGAGNGGAGGGGGGVASGGGSSGTGGTGLNPGQSPSRPGATGSLKGGNGGANTGGGGGAGQHDSGDGGNGGSGIVMIRYPIAIPEE